MSRKLVFVHGSGRVGAANWPNQVELFADAVFLTMPGYGDESPAATNMDEWVSRVLDLDGEMDVVAHSYGGLPAIFSAARAPERVRSLTLFEPAAYSYARGRLNAEAMIDRMTPIVDKAPIMSTIEYHLSFISALTGSGPPQPQHDSELIAAERNRLLAAPWSFDLPTDVLSAVPTLVLTGAWNEEYEEIGQTMAYAGGAMLSSPASVTAFRTTLMRTPRLPAGSHRTLSLDPPVRLE
ncbi:alpha/beta fold hydrolase [Cryobacterium melibiosiphilum]|uniref:alpha/beta fold hydrolase n=1 Tax=Cryobacterium melibiosiphilum TaxID=995039 RepID=UPI0013145B92|nr:alpha/beta fold hydrolase [Cryobacterium melibiosiphilum]